MYDNSAWYMMILDNVCNNESFIIIIGNDVKH